MNSLLINPGFFENSFEAGTFDLRERSEELESNSLDSPESDSEDSTREYEGVCIHSCRTKL